MTNFYDTEEALSRYLWLHYGETDAFEVEGARAFHSALGFPIACAARLIEGREKQGGRALDIGCAVGRSTFELSRWCDEVVGIDKSALFIDTARRLKSGEAITYRLVSEGVAKTVRTASLPPGARPERTQFVCADALALLPSLGLFDSVLVANLVCRLPDPRAFLVCLPSLVRSGGRLLLTTPCSWREEYTAPEKWLGGREENHRILRTFDTVAEILSPYFELEWRADMPLLIPEHARKFELIIADATRWRRR